MEEEEHKLENDTSLEEMENREDHPVKDNAMGTLPGANMAIEGQKMLSIIIGLFSCVVAVPVLLIYFIKSPPPLQDVYTFGISYYNLVFIFLISAVGLILSLFFFLRLRVPVILAIFISSLFCCLPLLMGLKNDLTLQQAILNISFFSGWPFFLRPLYFFIELMLPLGILIFLFLQFKSIFSRKTHGYTFLGAAIYLTAVAFIGFSGLIQAGQPNVITALAENGYISISSDDRSTALEKTPVSSDDSLPEVQLRGSLSSDFPEGEIAGQPETTPGQSSPPVEDSKVAMQDRKLELLEGKTNSLSEESVPVWNPLTGKDQSEPVPVEPRPHVAPQNVQPLNESALTEINHNLVLLFSKINQVAESLEKLKNPVIDSQQSEIADVGRKVELLTVKLDKLLSGLNQTEYSTSLQQGYTDKKSVAPSSTTQDQNITSRDLAGILQKIEILSNKVDQISDSFVKKGLYAPQGGREIE